MDSGDNRVAYRVFFKILKIDPENVSALYYMRLNPYSWFGDYRRLSKSYEFLPTMSEMIIFASMIHIMMR